MRAFTEPAMRPPQEARSLLLRATQGCTYNDCHFCYVSRGYPFMAVSTEELEREVLTQKPFFPETTAIYMTGSNPLALPVRTLRDYLGVLRKHFPRFARLSLQGRIDDITAKSDAELRELCGLGLSHIYIGTENGHDEVLRLMNKGHDSSETVEQLLRLDAAGMTYTNFYILGMGGRGMGRACGEATARMFNKVHPRRITTTGMTLFAGTPVAAMAERGEFVEATEREKIEELRVFLQTLDIDTIYDGVHYLNPLNYRFSNRDAVAKAEVLADIDETLASCSEEELERMVDRKRMRSL
ncbi:MAG: radical SAM protein [Desulfovibrio sp.]|nr:radical SAM protein [Desulfovibrio sp.]